jgi:hypothetical protein
MSSEDSKSVMRRKYHLTAGLPKYIPDLKSSVITLYVIITKDGTLKQVGKVNHDSRVKVYRQQKRAEGQAKDEGDSVVEVSVYLDKEPVFIRRKPLG